MNHQNRHLSGRWGSAGMSYVPHTVRKNIPHPFTVPRGPVPLMQLNPRATFQQRPCLEEQNPRTSFHSLSRGFQRNFRPRPSSSVQPWSYFGNQELDVHRHASGSFSPRQYHRHFRPRSEQPRQIAYCGESSVRLRSPIKLSHCDAVQDCRPLQAGPEQMATGLCTVAQNTSDVRNHSPVDLEASKVNSDVRNHSPVDLEARKVNSDVRNHSPVDLEASKVKTGTDGDSMLDNSAGMLRVAVEDPGSISQDAEVFASTPCKQSPAVLGQCSSNDDDLSLTRDSKAIVIDADDSECHEETALNHDKSRTDDCYIMIDDSGDSNDSSDLSRCSSVDDVIMLANFVADAISSQLPLSSSVGHPDDRMSVKLEDLSTVHSSHSDDNKLLSDTAITSVSIPSGLTANKPHDPQEKQLPDWKIPSNKLEELKRILETQLPMLQKLRDKDSGSETVVSGCSSSDVKLEQQSVSRDIVSFEPRQMASVASMSVEQEMDVCGNNVCTPTDTGSKVHTFVADVMARAAAAVAADVNNVELTGGCLPTSVPVSPSILGNNPELVFPSFDLQSSDKALSVNDSMDCILIEADMDVDCIENNSRVAVDMSCSLQREESISPLCVDDDGDNLGDLPVFGVCSSESAENQIEFSFENYPEVSKTKLTLDDLLKEKRKRAKQELAAANALQDAAKNSNADLQSGDIDLKPEHQEILNKLRVPKEKIPEMHPGISLFHNSCWLQLFSYPDTLTLASCGFTPGKSQTDSRLSSLSPVELLEFLEPNFIQLVFRAISCPHAFSSWVFYLLSICNDSFVACKLHRILYNIIHSTTCDWVPSVLAIARVFVNYGAELSDVCIFPHLLTFTPSDLQFSCAASLCNGTSPADIKENVGLEFHIRNLKYVFQIMTDAMAVRYKKYTSDECMVLLLMAMRVSLDSRLAFGEVHLDIQNFLAAAINAIPPESWSSWVLKLCDHVVELCDHHHNMVYVVSLLPLVERGEYLQRVLSYVFLQHLLPSPPDLDDILETEITKTLQLLNSLPPLSNDVYLSLSYISLIEYSVGTDDIKQDEKDELKKLLSAVQHLSSRIPHLATNDGQARLKDQMVILSTKWDLMLKSLGSDTIFSSDRSMSIPTQIVREASDSSDCSDAENNASAINGVI